MRVEKLSDHGVILRSDLLGGCSVILFVTLIGWVALKLRLPLWVARTLLVVTVAGVSYLAGDAIVPEYNRPWGVWLVAAAVSVAPISIGWTFIAADYKAHEAAERWAREARDRDRNENR